MNLVADLLKISDRHKARLLTNLEEAGADKSTMMIVRKEFDWYRDDVMIGAKSNLPRGKPRGF